MKIAFISDIHGNAVALESVLIDIKRKKADKIFVLGDICLRGPEPERSLELIRSLNTEVIKGNADEWVVRGIKRGEVKDQAFDIMWEEREWTLSKLDNDSVKYLDSLPTELKLEDEGLKIHAFHACPINLFDIISPNEEDEVYQQKLFLSEADIYIYAHIHKPFIRFINGKCVMNIGSIGLPFDGNNRSSYAILDIKENSYEVSIVRVKYEIRKVIEQLQRSNYPNKDFVIDLLVNAKP